MLFFGQVDLAGNQDRSPATVTCVRDSVPPVTRVSIVGPFSYVQALNASAVAASAVNLSLGANEPTRGYYVAVDGMSVNATGSVIAVPTLISTSSVLLANLILGRLHTVVVQASDLTGARVVLPVFWTCLCLCVSPALVFLSEC